MRQESITERDESSVEVAVSAAILSPTQATRLPLQRRRVRGFTLAELLVSVGVLVLFVFLATQFLNSAATVTTLGHKQVDADSQARQLLDRMAVDFAQILKRSDVSYYAKTGNTQVGNDQMAFFSAAPGYYSQAGYNSNVSLVAYRVNADTTSASYNKLERMGKGLALNGAYTPGPSGTPIPLLFLNSASNPTTRIQDIWPAACYPSCTSNSTYSTDPDYETAGPQVFRFEYYYLLNSALSANALSNGAVANKFSGGPWSDVNSFVVIDVAAIVVDIAAIDPKSKVLLTDAQITTLAEGLADFPSDAAAAAAMVPGQLRAQWQTYLDGITNLPRPAVSGIRVYERYFYLNQ